MSPCRMNVPSDVMDSYDDTVISAFSAKLRACRTGTTLYCGIFSNVWNLYLLILWFRYHFGRYVEILVHENCICIHRLVRANFTVTNQNPPVVQWSKEYSGFIFHFSCESIYYDLTESKQWSARADDRKVVLDWMELSLSLRNSHVFTYNSHHPEVWEKQVNAEFSDQCC